MTRIARTNIYFARRSYRGLNSKKESSVAKEIVVFGSIQLARTEVSESLFTITVISMTS